MKRALPAAIRQIRLWSTDFPGDEPQDQGEADDDPAVRLTIEAIPPSIEK
jgi:hypothetical protein